MSMPLAVLVLHLHYAGGSGHAPVFALRLRGGAEASLPTGCVVAGLGTDCASPSPEFAGQVGEREN
jgi:hypothetical protein